MTSPEQNPYQAPISSATPVEKTSGASPYPKPPAVSSTDMVAAVVKAHGVGNAIIYCIAMLIPCIGLILLVFLNSRATNYLKRHGVKVGLMGADLSTLPSSR